jgi:hypothetical protein
MKECVKGGVNGEKRLNEIRWKKKHSRGMFLNGRA